MTSSSSSTSRVADPAARLRAYFASLPAETRAGLEVIREAIRSAAPSAVEDFGYGMPAFRFDGQPLVWYAAWKRHYSLYPIGADILRAHAPLFDSYGTSKGTIRFPSSDPPQPALVRLLVTSRIAELRTKGDA